MALSVMSKSSGQERFISAALLVTLATVFRDTPQLCAMFRLLNPKLFKRRISRYLVIMVTSFICIHTKVCIYSIKETTYNRAKSGSGLPESVAPILRNGGSQSPDRWLKEPRNNHPCFISSGQSYYKSTYSILKVEKKLTQSYLNKQNGSVISKNGYKKSTSEEMLTLK